MGDFAAVDFSFLVLFASANGDDAVCKRKGKISLVCALYLLPEDARKNVGLAEHDGGSHTSDASCHVCNADVYTDIWNQPICAAPSTA